MKMEWNNGIIEVLCDSSGKEERHLMNQCKSMMI